MQRSRRRPCGLFFSMIFGSSFLPVSVFPVSAKHYSKNKIKKFPSLEEVFLNSALDPALQKLFFAAKSGDAATVAEGIQAGLAFDMRLPEDAQTWAGATPLYVAATYGHNQIVEMLLAVGAYVNNRLGYPNQRGSSDFPKWGGTALLEAILNNRLETTKILLEAGADITETMGFENAVAMHIATMADCSSELIKLLYAYGAQINNVLTDAYRRFDNPCKGSTPLLVAINRDNRANVKTLLVLGADKEIECPPFLDHSCEVTPLFLAVVQSSVGIVKELIMSGVNLNRRIKEGSLAGGTALHLAVANGREEMVALLMTFGVDIHVKTATGKTAFDLAKEHEYKKIALLITKKRLNNAFSF